jgi:aminoglycoside/choline kinase family phosphotransferase
MTATTDRDQVIQRFLRLNGHGDAVLRPLPGDASLRRYARLEGRNALLMDAPPPDSIAPFIKIAKHLRELGVSVPTILATDESAGLLIEEDLGDQLFSSILDTTNTTALIDAAVDVLVVMHRAAPPADLPKWDKFEMIGATLSPVFEWWWPAMFGQRPPIKATSDITAALDQMLYPVSKGPVSFVHRDFFAGNLLWLPDRDGPRRVGVIDFQSAALGYPAYDLASLLQDSRRPLPVDVEEHAIARYLAARPDLDPIAFRESYDVCATQRHLRVACQWVRLAKRDGRPQYLVHAPHTWAMLTRVLERPAAAPLARIIDRWIPLEKRCNPPGLTP